MIVATGQPQAVCFQTAPLHRAGPAGGLLRVDVLAATPSGVNAVERSAGSGIFCDAKKPLQAFAGGSMFLRWLSLVQPAGAETTRYVETHRCLCSKPTFRGVALCLPVLFPGLETRKTKGRSV
jgi:hypothetical protein